MSEESGTTDEEGTGSGSATTADELKERLTEYIDAARARLEELRDDLASMQEEDQETLRRKSDEVHRRIDEQRERARQIRAELTAWEQEKAGHTREAIASWRQQRQIKKLQSRAERAEDYAARAVVIAALDFEEAEQAVLDAVMAKFDAASAASPRP